MAEVIQKLREDHKKLTQLLDLIAREVRKFDAGELPDYDLVRLILDYILNYPDLYHHPLEDQVLRRLRRRDPAATASVGDLDAEHEKLGGLTRRFAAALDNVLHDETLPRDWFVDLASDYLNFQRRHMQMEEVLFFPAALRALEDADWTEIAAADEKHDDPLFRDGAGPGKYDRLHREIIRWAAPVDETKLA